MEFRHLKYVLFIHTCACLCDMSKRLLRKKGLLLIIFAQFPDISPHLARVLSFELKLFYVRLPAHSSSTVTAASSHSARYFRNQTDVLRQPRGRAHIRVFI